MKTIFKALIATVALSTVALFAAPVEVQHVGALPANCQAVENIKIGDTAMGFRLRADIVSEARNAAAKLGSNYVLIDVQRINNPKQGVYYWGWGTVGTCK